VQVSLLRLIDQKRFQRLGGRRPLSTDVRIIAATNDDLSEAVRKGTFREDLFYRLDVFHIVMPPLRDRQGDLPLLIDAFLKRYNDTFQKEIRGIAPECVSIFENYKWPGNVRELKNVIQRAVLVCSETVLSPEHLPPRLLPERTPRPTVSFDVGTPLAEVEREMIVQALSFTGNNRKRAAEILGISRRALYNRLARHNMK
jgi:transcriptional regulator with PAS, ATPase and Fis domain